MNARLTALAAALLVLAVLPVPALAGEFDLEPSIALTEEYNDNVLLTAEEETEDYLTTGQFSLKGLYDAPLWHWELDYTANAIYYARNSREEEVVHAASASTRISLVPDVLFLEVEDEYARVSLDVARDFTRESTFVNQSDRNTFYASPYVRFRLSERLSLSAGYYFSDTEYEEAEAVDKEEQGAYGSTTWSLSPQTDVSLGYRHTQTESDEGDYTKDNASLSLSHQFGEKLRAGATVGNTWLDFDGNSSFSKVFWNASLNYDVQSLAVTVATFRGYDEDPRTALIRIDGHSLLAIIGERGRTSLSSLFFFREYTNARLDILETSIYGVELDLSHALTSSMTGVLSADAEEVKERIAGARIRRYAGGVRLERQVNEYLNATLGYGHVLSESDENEDDNYRSNSVSLEVRVSF